LRIQRRSAGEPAPGPKVPGRGLKVWCRESAAENQELSSRTAGGSRRQAPDQQGRATCLGVVSVIWVAFGYSLAFGTDAGGGLIGTFGQSGLDLLVPGEGPVVVDHIDVVMASAAAG
jgi:hypothetical protein